MKAFDPAGTKHFKTPKYTGVFLSLLSMFVLASMLVVWKQIPKVEKSQKLEVRALSCLRQCMESIGSSFEEEMSVEVSFSYFPNEGMIRETLSAQKEFAISDLFVLPESQFLDDPSSRVPSAERIPVAFIPQSHSANSTTESVLLFAKLNGNTQNPQLALQFARYLAAPSRGQFVFAKNGFGGVNGDLWSERPNLTIFMNHAHDLQFAKRMEDFEMREGVSLQRNTLSPDKMEATLKIISQSDAPEFLPDLVFLGQESLWMLNFSYVLMPTSSTNPSAPLVYAAEETPFPSIRKRLLTFLVDRKKET